MDYITKNKVQISYMDFRGLCVRWAYRVHGNMFVCHKTIYRWIKIGLLKSVFNFSDEKDGRINVYQIKISCEVVKVSMIDLKHLMSVLN